MKIKIPRVIRKTNPLWTKKLLSRRSYKKLQESCTIDGKELDITRYHCCIVGEALNLFDKRLFQYDGNEIDMHNGCGTCVRFSSRFNRIINHSDYATPNEKNKMMEDGLKEFSIHMKEVHPELIT